MELDNSLEKSDNGLIKTLNVTRQHEMFFALHACKTQGIPSGDPGQFLGILEEYTDENGKECERFIPAS